MTRTPLIVASGVTIGIGATIVALVIVSNQLKLQIKNSSMEVNLRTTKNSKKQKENTPKTVDCISIIRCKICDKDIKRRASSKLACGHTFYDKCFNTLIQTVCPRCITAFTPLIVAIGVIIGIGATVVALAIVSEQLNFQIKNSSMEVNLRITNGKKQMENTPKNVDCISIIRCKICDEDIKGRASSKLACGHTFHHKCFNTLNQTECTTEFTI